MSEPARIVSLDNIHPALIQWWLIVSKEWKTVQPDLQLRIHESLRTQERHDWLLAQKPPVTWVKHSPHQDGNALDVYIYVDGIWIPGNTKAELALYRAFAEFGQRFWDQPSGTIFNLGARIGKDWYHWQVDISYVEFP
jgi:hypothetical protein